MAISPIFPIQIAFYVIAIILLLFGVAYLALWRIGLYPKFEKVFLYLGIGFIIISIALMLVAFLFIR